MYSTDRLQLRKQNQLTCYAVKQIFRNFCIFRADLSYSSLGSVTGGLEAVLVTSHEFKFVKSRIIQTEQMIMYVRFHKL